MFQTIKQKTKKNEIFLNFQAKKVVKIKMTVAVECEKYVVKFL